MKQEHFYEGLFILDSEAYNKNQEGSARQIAETIETLGGKVRVNRIWEERKLAFPIKHRTHGTYWIAYFRIDTSKMVDLNRQFQLNNNILRFQILEIDARLEEEMIRNAERGPVKHEEEKPESDDVNYDSDDDDDDDDEEEVK